MKTFIALFLCITLLFSCAFAENYAGCWAVWIPNAVSFYGNYCFILVLNEDKTMVMSMILDLVDECNVSVNTVTGKWAPSADGVSIKDFDHDTPVPLEYSEGFLWFTLGEKRFGLKKIDDFKIGQVQLISD